MTAAVDVLTGQDLDDTRLAEQLAGAVGELLVELRDEVVAVADRGPRAAARARHLMVSLLRARRPLDLVQGEPAVDPLRRPGRVWIVDPLDGVEGYVRDRTDWSVQVALWVGDDVSVGAVALPGLGWVLSSGCAAPPYPREGRLRIAVPRSPSALLDDVARDTGARLLPIGSTGYRVAAVVRGQADAYVQDGALPERSVAGAYAVARAAGLHLSRLDGTPVRFNQAAPWVEDLLVCRAELADDLLRVLGRSSVPHPGSR